MPTPRNARIEILRIAAMIGIVAHHYAVHGGVMDVTFDKGAAIQLSVISGFGKWGVDLFVLVGAFFMVKQPTRGRGLAAIYSQVLPISWLVLAAVAVTMPATLTAGAVKDSLLPVIFGQYWFVTAYVVLVLIAPYLALVATRLERVQLLRLIVVGVLLWSIFTLVNGVWLGVSNLAWFALLFMIAAYMRLHPLPGSPRAWTVAALVTGLALPVAIAVATTLRWNATGLPEDLAWPRELIAGQYSPLALAFAVAVLGAAVKRRERHSRLVAYWASAAFGVYLLHDNPLLREWLWVDVIDTPRAAAQPWLMLHAVVAVLAVYLACSLIVFALQPIVIRPALKVATAIRVRVERRLAPAHEREGPASP